MKHAMCALLLVGGLLVGSGRRATAQAAWSASLALQGGSVHGGEYRRDRSELLIIGRIERRIWAGSGTALFVGLSAEQPFGDVAVTADCEIGSHGQCLEDPPEVRDFMVTLGVHRQLPARFTVDVGGGVGELFDWRWGSAHQAFSGDFNIALRLFGPVHLTGGGRVVSWHDAGVSLHSYTQVYGIRLN